MAADNTVTITGNITRDPELRYTPGGQAVLQLGLACGRRYFDKTEEEWKEIPGFYDVTVWGEMAENCSESLAKGNRITVAGRLDYRAWEADDGSKRSKVEIVADEISASLRWATVEITRTTGGGGGGRDDGDPGPTYNPNEEPF